MADYQPRIVDDQLTRRLGAIGAVVIEGPKACGKTVTAQQISASEVALDIDEAAREAAGIDPALVLAGEVPRLIDEWQLEPRIWDHVRRTVDSRGEPGQFILTGSAVPADDATGHSGAGRISRLRMRPMSLYELNRSNGEISVAALLNAEAATAADPGLTVPDLVEEASRGGWPGFRSLELDDALQAVRSYLEEIRRVDIRRVDGVRRDRDKVGQLLRSLARNVATHTRAATLAADTAREGAGIERHSVTDYLEALTRLMIVEDQPPWPTHLRSKVTQRGAPKRHFVDPSLAVAALAASPEPLLRDLNYFGYLFESLVVRDLRVYAQSCDASVLQYRDNRGLEADAVVQAADGRWAAFEVKLGAGQVDDGAASILKFAEQIDAAKSGEPAALGVIVGTGYGYVRDDGVQVIPIGALGP